MNYLAAHYLGKVLTQNFLGTRIISCEGDEEGFCCEAEVRGALSLEMLKEAMEAQLAMGEAVEFVEMVPVSVKGLFESRGQPFLAKSVGNESLVSLVSLVRIGDYYGLCPPLEEKRLGAFVLDAVEGEGRVRICGRAAGSRKKLKEIKKKVGVELGFYAVVGGEVLLLPKGRLVGQNIIRWWEKVSRADGVELVVTTRGSLEEHLGLGMARSGEVSWAGDVTYLFCSADRVKEERISSLQFLEQGAKMLGLESHFGELTLSRVKNGPVVIIRRMFGPLPQAVARLVEAHQGRMPLWLLGEREIPKTA